jgi:UDP-hydrolysing UDP-N-acetyl-D-glucosamine 2-epimerase
MSKRIVAVFTGNRAEYGLQFPILRAIDSHPDLEYRLIVSGAHLDNNFGKTLGEIASDGFRVDAEVKIDMDADSLFATAQAIGSGVTSISECLAQIRPDLMVVYADRFEGFAAVIAATQMNVPTAHIEGGDLTEGGALDDSVRHAMTKLSHLHFTTNQQASNRILAMGEEAWRVHTVGFPAIDLISDDRFAKADEIVGALSLDLDKPIVLFTQHSVTTEFDQAAEQVRPSLEAMARLAERGVQVILTYPNNDAGGRAIIDELNKFGTREIPGTVIRSSLGRHLYHGVLGLAMDESRNVVCVGNSSSGIKETPAFNCPTVNIGSRQAGRLRAENVIDAPYDADAIFAAVDKALFDPDFRRLCRETDNPYYLGGAGPKVAKVLAEVPLDAALLRKRMTLLGEAKDGWYR